MLEEGELEKTRICVHLYVTDRENRDSVCVCVRGGERPEKELAKPTWRQSKTDKQTDRKTHRSRRVGGGEGGGRAQ